MQEKQFEIYRGVNRFQFNNCLELWGYLDRTVGYPPTPERLKVVLDIVAQEGQIELTLISGLGTVNEYEFEVLIKKLI